MKKIFKSSLIIVALAALTLLPIAAVSAQTTPENGTETETTQVSSGKTVRCTVSQVRLNTRIERMERLQTARETAYKGLITKIEKVIKSAKTAEYDTSDLEAAKTAVEKKLTAFSEASAAYLKSLSATKNLSCGDSDNDYSLALIASRGELLKLRTANLEVKTSFHNTAIPALKDYATWLKEQTSNEGGAN